MEHVAILSKKWKLLDKIISGEKKIESRWYKFKRAPFGYISEGNTIYFKESGDPVTVKAQVEKILIFDKLNHDIIGRIIKEYGNLIGIKPDFAQEVSNKRLCILIFLKDVQKIEPFNINKAGYGLMSAWISTDDINKIKK
jgi:ASC-1-like (ASCH) protein